MQTLSDCSGVPSSLNVKQPLCAITIRTLPASSCVQRSVVPVRKALNRFGRATDRLSLSTSTLPSVRPMPNSRRATANAVIFGARLSAAGAVGPSGAAGAGAGPAGGGVTGVERSIGETIEPIANVTWRPGR